MSERIPGRSHLEKVIASITLFKETIHNFLLGKKHHPEEDVTTEWEYKPIEQVVREVTEIFDVLPLIYKHYMTHQDVLLVMAGLKNASDLSFVGDTWDENAFEQMKTVFELYGLKFSEIKTQSTISDQLFSRQGFIYNRD